MSEPEVSVPGFVRPSMDGYAVRGEDTFGASSDDRIALTVVGESLPGSPYKGVLAAGAAVRYHTGAPVPDGANAVVMAEVCEEQDGRVAVADAVAPQRNMDQIGEDVREASLCFSPGAGYAPRTRACSPPLESPPSNVFAVLASAYSSPATNCCLLGAGRTAPRLSTVTRWSSGFTHRARWGPALPVQWLKDDPD